MDPSPASTCPPSTLHGRRFARASFTVPAPIGRVFPLFDPLEEARWVPGWQIEPVRPLPFCTERGAVFLTRAGEHEAVWTVLRHAPAEHAVEYLVVVPGFQQRWITVSCAAAEDETEVAVSYDVTALGAAGEAALERYDEAFLRGWQEPVARAASEVSHG